MSECIQAEPMPNSGIQLRELKIRMLTYTDVTISKSNCFLVCIKYFRINKPMYSVPPPPPVCACCSFYNMCD